MAYTYPVRSSRPMRSNSSRNQDDEERRRREEEERRKDAEIERARQKYEAAGKERNEQELYNTLYGNSRKSQEPEQPTQEWTSTRKKYPSKSTHSHGLRPDSKQERIEMSMAEAQRREELAADKAARREESRRRNDALYGYNPSSPVIGGTKQRIYWNMGNDPETAKKLDQFRYVYGGNIDPTNTDGAPYKPAQKLSPYEKYMQANIRNREVNNDDLSYVPLNGSGKGMTPEKWAERENQFANLTENQTRLLDDLKTKQSQNESLEMMGSYIDDDGRIASYANDAARQEEEDIRNKLRDTGLSDEIIDEYIQNDGRPQRTIEEELQLDSYYTNQLDKDSKAVLNDYLDWDEKEKLARESGNIGTLDPTTGAVSRNDADVAARQKELLKEQFMYRTGQSEEEFELTLERARRVYDYNRNIDQQNELHMAQKEGGAGEAIGQNLAVIAGSLGNGLGVVKDTLQGQYDPAAPSNIYGDNFAGVNEAANIQQITAANIGDAVENRYGNKEIANVLGHSITPRSVAEFAYQTGMSTAESALQMAAMAPVAGLAPGSQIGSQIASTAAMAPFGYNSYASSLKENLENGMTQSDAQTMALVSGAAEIITEKFSADKFWDILKQNNATARKRVVDFLMSSVIEGSEEVASDVINDAADIILMGDYSENRQKYDGFKQKYLQEGMSEKDAERAAWGDFLNDKAYEYGQSGLGGFVSGGVHGATATAVNIAQTQKAANTALQNGDFGAVAQSISTNEEDYRNKSALDSAKAAKQMAEKYAEQKASGKEVTGRQVRKLYEAMQDALNTEAETENSIKVPEPEAADERFEQRVVDQYAGKGNNISARDAVAAMARAQTPEQLVMVRKAAEASRDSSARAAAQAAYQLNKGRIASENNLVEADFEAAENTPTESEAFEAGIRGEELAEGSSEALQRAYKSGEMVSRLRAGREGANAAEAVLRKDGTTVNITGITGFGENMKVHTSGGDVSVRDMATSATKYLYEAASKYGSEKAAQNFIENYDGKMPVGRYTSIFDKYYAYGGTNARQFEDVYKNDKIAKQFMKEDQLRSIYEYGQTERAAQLESNAMEQGKSIAVRGEGKVIDNRKEKTDIEYKPVLEAMARATGMNIVLADDMAENINGTFNRAMQSITLNTKNGDNLLNTLFHEGFGEVMQAHNAEGAARVQQAVFDYIAEDEDMLVRLGRAYQEAYIGVEGTKTFYDAMSEMVNDSIAGLFSTQEGIHDFAEWAQNRHGVSGAKTILQSTADYFKGIADSFKRLLQKGGLSKASQRTARMAEDRAREIRKMILQEMDVAIENARKAGIDPNAESTQAYSVNVPQNITINGNPATVNDTGEFATIDATGRVVPIVIGSDFSANDIKNEHSTVRTLVRDALKQLNGTQVTIKSDGSLVIADKRLAKEYTGSKDTQRARIDEKTAKYNLYSKITDVVENAENPRWRANNEPKHNRDAGRGWRYYDVTFGIGDKDLTIYNGVLNVRMDMNGNDYIYDVTKIKSSQTIPLLSGKTTFANPGLGTSKGMVSQGRHSVNVDSAGNTLSDAQAEYFKDSKVRDENGRLKVMYHGTQNDFNIFDFSQGGKNGTAEGFGIYLSDNKDVSSAYGGRIVESYVNMTRPARSDARTITRRELSSLIKQTVRNAAQEMAEDYDGDIAAASKDTWISNYTYTYDKSLDASIRDVADQILRMNSDDMAIVQEVMAGMSIMDYDAASKFYDLLTDITGIDGFITSWTNHEDGSESEIALAFRSNQIKNITNQSPTNNLDIRYSINAADANYDKAYNEITDMLNTNFSRYSLNVVEPVQPTSDDWYRGASFAEVKEQFPGLFNTKEDQDDPETRKRNKTQTTSTKASYSKYFEMLGRMGFNGSVLDASSGLGLGTVIGREAGFDVDDIEPYWDKNYRAGGKPKYDDYSSLFNSYDCIISNAVLNVIPQDQRDDLIVKMGEMLNPGGMMIINVRGVKDVETSSGKEAIDANNHEWYIPQSGSYQKGFTYPELVAYVKDALGDDYTVTPLKRYEDIQFASGAVIVRVDRASDSVLDSRYTPKGAARHSVDVDTSVTLKTLKGSSIKRSKWGVGKDIGGQVYFHKNYVNDLINAGVIPQEVYDRALELLPDGFEYNTMMYDYKAHPDRIRFDSAPNFDTAREPYPGEYMTVDTTTGEVKPGKNYQIWHHKWQWVKEDYTGFDVGESYLWSKKWLENITNPSGQLPKWNDALRAAGLPLDDENNYDVSKSRFSVNVGYHAGDLGKAESLGNQSGNRGTGHFGTGTYFVGSEADLTGDYAKRPHEAVDFSNYNLYQPGDYKRGMALHEFLKGVNDFFDRGENEARTVDEWERRVDDLRSRLWDREGDQDELIQEATDLFGEYAVEDATDGADDIYDALDRMIDRNGGQAERVVGRYERWHDSMPVNDLFGISAEEADEIVRDIRDEIASANYSIQERYTADSASTRFMKRLGYEGVDVRGVDGLDNTMYGSVIYDLKGEALQKKYANGARYSVNVDTEGRGLSDAQQEYFKDSMMLDDEGRLKVMYHGTPKAGFTVFESWKSHDKRSLFFTDSPAVARTYSGTENMYSPAGEDDVIDGVPANYEVYLNLKNPYIVDAEGNEWYEIPDRGGVYTTGEISEYAEYHDYDGVIIKNVYDDGEYGMTQDAHTVAIAFDGNQIKSVENKNPTRDHDIRRSVVVDDFFGDSYGMEDSYTQMTLAGAGSILEDGAKALKGKTVDEKLIRGIASELRNKYGSTYDLNTFAENLRKVFAYAQGSDSVDYNDLMNLVREVAQPVIDEATQKVGQEEYDAFLAAIGNQKIRLTDRQKDAVREIFGSYPNFQRAMRGVRINDNGDVTLDQIWNELVDAVPGMLDYDVTEGDMPLNLYDALATLKPTVRNMYGENNEEAAADLAMEIVEQYYEQAGRATGNEAAKTAAQRMREQGKRYRERVRERYNERLKEAKERLKEQRKQYGEKVRADRDQKIAEMRAKNRQRAVDIKERREAARQRDMVNSSARKLMQWAYNPNDKHHIPKSMLAPVAEFLSALDFVDPHVTQNKKTGKWVVRILNHTVRNSNGDFVRNEFDTIEADSRAEAVRKYKEMLGRGLGSRAAKSWQQRMQVLQDLLENIKNERTESRDLDDITSILDKDLADELRDLLQRNRDVLSVSNLNAADLKILNKVLRGITHAINVGNKAFMSNDNIRDLAEDTMTMAKNDRARRKDHSAGINKILDNITLDMATPLTYFKMLGEGGHKVYKGLRQALNAKVADIRTAQEYFEETVGKDAAKQIQKWTGKKAEIHEFQTVDGTIRMTTAQIMSLYELSKRQQAMLHTVGGFTPSTLTVNKKEVSQPVMHLTEDMIREITDTLTPEQKRIADALQQFMANQCSDWGNEAALTMYGYEKFSDPNYFPISVDKNTVSVNNSAAATGLINAIKNSGFTKQVTPNAQNPLVVHDIFDVFTNHVTDMATYHGFAPAITDALRWFNYRTVDTNQETSFNYQQTVQGAVEAIYGQRGGKQYFVKLIGDLNQMEKSSYISNGMVDTLVSHYKVAAVGGNLRVVIQQPTAYARALNTISGKYLLRALSANPKAVMERAAAAKDQNMIAWWKGQGYYETAIGKSMKEMITGATTTMDKIRNLSTAAAGAADDVTWGALYRAVELEQADIFRREGNSTDSEEYRQAVNDRFDDLVDETQVVDATLLRSQYMRSQDMLNKLQTAFMAEPMKSYNMLLQSAMTSMRENNAKPIVKSAVVFTATSVLTALAAGLVDAFRRDDDETSWFERWLKASGANFGDNINPLGLMPVIKDFADTAVSIIAGETTFASSSARMDIDAVNNMLSAAQKTVKYFNRIRSGEGPKANEATLYGVVKTDLKALSQLTGVPVYGLWRDLGENLINAFGYNLQTNYKPYDRLHYAINTGEFDVKEEVDTILDSGRDKGDISTSLKKKYGEALIDTQGTPEGDELRQDILDALVEAGYEEDKANAKIESWINPDAEEERGGEEYVSEYQGVYDAIDSGSDPAAAVQELLSAGKKASSVKTTITRRYKDDMIQVYGSGDMKAASALKQQLIVAYMAAGMTRDEANKKINEWLGL